MNNENTINIGHLKEGAKELARWLVSQIHPSMEIDNIESGYTGFNFDEDGKPKAVLFVIVDCEEDE